MLMKATTLLEQQHRKAEQLLGKLLRTRAGGEKLLGELADVLATHLVIEEQIFYPTIQKKLPPKATPVVLGSYEEHAVARFELERLLATSSQDPTFQARTKALRDLVLDHIEEEEHMLFPLVARHLDDAALEALGRELSGMTEQCLRAGHKKLLSLTTARRTKAAPSGRTTARAR